MNSTLTRSASILLALTAGSALAADNRWIGGDTSNTDASVTTYHDDANWSLGAYPVGGSADNIFIDTDGDFARWITSQSGYAVNGTINIGSASNPHVTVEYLSNRRYPNVTNLDYSQLQAYKMVSILGTNTTVRIGTGLCFALNGSSPAMIIDEDATLCGTGVLAFNGGANSVWSRDYDALWLTFCSSSSAQTYTLAGDVKTTGRVTATQGGTAGVNGLATLNLGGHTLEAGEVVLGLKDARANDNGDQSGFGAIYLSGGTLKVSGDITSVGNPDGLKTDQTPLTQQNALSSDGHGGTIELAGSFTNILTRSAENWFLEDVDLLLNGDGTAVQELEVLSDDLGDQATSCLDNFFWKSITLGDSASVRLVDVNDNARNTTGAECVYVGTLTLPEGATLDLNGLTVYVFEDFVNEGTLVENGGKIVTLNNAGLFSTVTKVLGTPGTTPVSHSFWVGSMVVGDLDADGNNELIVLTMDEDANSEASGDDSRLFVLRYANGALSDVAPFPKHDSVLANHNTIENFLIDDIGAGPRLFYNHNGYTRIYALDKDGNRTTISPEDNVLYGPAPYYLYDINKDGEKELITTARNSDRTLRVYKTSDKSLIWSAFIPGDSDNLMSYSGIADLDGDKDMEILVVAKGSGATRGFYAFHHDGTPYFANQPLHFTTSPGESFGGVSAADVTGDGIPEIIFAGGNNNGGEGLTVLSQNGTEIFRTTNWKDANGFALLDVDRDGVYEILHSDTLYKGDGTLLQKLPNSGYPFTGYIAPVLADFNGDQIPEAVYIYSYNNDGNNGRYVSVYDFTTQSVLPGFPHPLESIRLDPTLNTWRVGKFHHWNGSTILVADLDKDGTWEIVVGVGIGTGNTQERPTLNVIHTPYHYKLPGARTPEEAGWYMYRRDALGTFRYPLYKEMGTLLLLL